MESLNEDQRRVFDRVSTHLQAQHSSAISNHPQPLRMFVSGCGGTGKSFLIKTLKAWIHSSLEKHAAITAPTGIAAFNGQAYVALSRVTSLDGLYLINFDPRSVKALDSAIIEYNRLRRKYRPTLAQFSVTKQRPIKVDDVQWCTIPWTSAVQRPAAQAITLKRKGFVNKDSVSSYANSVMQCVLFSPIVRRVILDGCDGAIKSLCRQYVSNADTTLDCTELHQELGSPFDGSASQDALKFLVLIMVISFEVHLPMHHTGEAVKPGIRNNGTAE